LKRVGIIFLFSILVFTGIGVGLIWLGRNALHNSDIPIRDHLLEESNPQTVMVFFAHPDDEIAVGGTLLDLRNQGHDLVMIYLTKGEAGPTGGLVRQEELGPTRALEMKKVAGILGAKVLEMFDFPDSGLENIPLDTLKSVALEMIEKHIPDYVISYDSEIGLYGHPDHRMASKAMQEVFLERKNDPQFPVKKLFQVTLSSKQIEVAMKIAPGFQRNYPIDTLHLPIPDFAVKTTPYFSTLVSMIDAHATQQEVFSDLLPYREQIPEIVYSRIFDREYFWEVK
jgi:LmbE family N-acetylglucosaminyl deacetylase